MATSTAAELEHVRASLPGRFRSHEKVPITKQHHVLRTLLYQLIQLPLADAAYIGANQFVYWNAANPKVSLAPDLFVRRAGPDEDFDCWKTWERGAPEMCVEIVCRGDSDQEAWEAKLARYKELGVTELVRFAPEEEEGRRLRVWDRLDEDLVERRVASDERTPATVLGLTWVVGPADDEPVALRLSRDEAGRDLLVTPYEALVAAKRERRAAEDQETRAREALERRVAELEAELARRR